MSELTLSKRMIDLIEGETGARDVTEDTAIEALGIDSLDFICLLQEIRKEIGEIDTKKATLANNVGDLIAAVQVA